MTKRILQLLVTVISGLIVHAAAAQGHPREYDVKAAMICNFAQFVDWPAEAFDSESANLVIEVIGKNPFGDALDEVAAGKRVGSRAITVRYVATADAIDACHLLFVPASEEANLAAIMRKTRNRAVLTVGECEAFPWAGGIIRLFADQGKVRFEVSVRAAADAGLKISSKLLKLSRIFDKG